MQTRKGRCHREGMRLLPPDLIRGRNDVRYRFMFKIIFIALVCLTFLVFFLIHGYEYYGWFVSSEGVHRHGNEKIQGVAITFDDGPHPVYTPLLLDILKQHHVKACFFLLGKNVIKFPEIAKRIHDEGHEIGNHSTNHKMLPLLRSDELKKEITETENAIKKATGEHAAYFRPPYGFYNERVRREVLSEGFTFVLWNLSSKDWMNQGGEKVARNVTKHLKPGAILLFHDGGSLVHGAGVKRDSTVHSLPLILDAIEKKGLKVMTLEELLKR